jgi:predicted P-loop ATPase/GTPase
MLGKRKNSDQSPKTPKMLETESIMAALSSQAIIEFEPDGTIISANDTYLSLVQYSMI